MDLFKLVGSIVINGTEQAKSDIVSVGNAAQNTAEAISRSNQTTASSNNSTRASWSTMKSAVDQYKAQGLSTSAAWKKATQEMKNATESAGVGMTNSFSKVGLAVGTFLGGAAIVGFGQTCVQAAADVQAMESQFTQVFGELEGNASEKLTNIANTAGISENRMKSSFTKIAAFAKTTGMDTEGALDLSERAMIAVADSAAFYDRSLEDVTDSLQSFLKGNYENDAALGLSCTETTRNAAANKLYGKSFKDLSEEQKQLTLLQMVEDANAASGALGQAARESDTWTNVMGNLKQSFKDFQAVLGALILPKVTETVNKLASAMQTLTEKATQGIEWAKEHKTLMTVLAVAFGTVATAIGAYTVAEKLKNIAVAAGVAAEGGATVAMGLHTVATNIATAATTAFGTVMAFVTSPITLVIAALGALIAIIIVVVKHWDVIKEKTLEIWESVKTAVGNAVETIKEKVSSAFETVKNKASEIWDSIKSAVSTAWDAITNVVTIGVKIIASILDAAFQIITLPFRFIWENCKEYIIAAWEGIKSAVSKAINAIKDKVTKDFNAVKSVVTTIFNAVKSVATSVWNSISNAVSKAVNAIKTRVTNDFNAVKSVVTTIFNKIKSVASSAWNSTKNAILGVINTLKAKIYSAFTSIKTKVTSVFNGIKSTATSVWNGIKNAITTPIEAAKNKVKSVVDSIKSMFSGLKLKLPDIKLPHFGITPSGWKIGDLLKGSVPKLSIKWYAEAMKNPIIMSKPTIFGYDSASGQLLGGGEAGTEVVSGASTLMNMIQSAVATQNEGMAYYLQKIIEVLADYFPQIISGLDRPICFDPEKGAAAMAVPMDRQLGILRGNKERGR